MDKVLVIGVSGKLGSGKDTVGSAITTLAKTQGFTVYRRAFGDAGKEEVADFLTRYTHEEKMVFLNEFVKNDDIFDEIMAQTFTAPPIGFWQKLGAVFGKTYVWNYYGYDAAIFERQMHDRTTKERYRALMQWWCTEYRRELFDPEYWRNRLEDWIHAKTAAHNFEDNGPLLFLVPDVRFPNEVHSIQERLEGYLIRVERPGHEPETKHKSEHLLNGYREWNATIINNQPLHKLKEVSRSLFLVACSWKWGNAGTSA